MGNVFLKKKLEWTQMDFLIDNKERRAVRSIGTPCAL